MTSNANDTAQWLRDRVEIEHLVYLYGRGNDVDVRYFDQCMTDDVEVEYPFGKWKGLEEHKRMHQATIPVTFTFTQHFLVNPVIEIDGNTATGHYNVFAAHGMTTPEGQKVVYAGAIYMHDLVRTPKGWRIKRHQCVTKWVDDVGGLMKAVQSSHDSHLGR